MYSHSYWDVELVDLGFNPFHNSVWSDKSCQHLARKRSHRVVVRQVRNRQQDLAACFELLFVLSAITVSVDLLFVLRCSKLVVYAISMYFSRTLDARLTFDIVLLVISDIVKRTERIDRPFCTLEGVYSHGALGLLTPVDRVDAAPASDCDELSCASSVVRIILCTNPVSFRTKHR